jgi:hypothetical protein
VLILALTESTKWHLRNFNCKQIILGISHDSGYAPFLDEVVQDDSIRRRITIVEGFPTVKDLVNIGLHILNLNGTIFRPDKLVDRTVMHPSPPPSNHGSATSTPAAVTSTTYAAITGHASPPPQILLPLATKAPAPPGRKTSIPTKPAAAPWSPGPRGLDIPLHVSQAALEGLKKRKDSSKKLCNNHYLRGPCAKGDACCFEHDYKPSREDMVAIAFMARLNPCTSGQDCENDNCIYGHHVSETVAGVTMQHALSKQWTDLMATVSKTVSQRPEWPMCPSVLQVFCE